MEKKLKKILWITTFRDFDSSYDRIIQNNFLNSLLLIKDVEIELFSTIFHENENKIKKVVRRYFKKSFFNNRSKYLTHKYKFSHSLLMIDALSYYLKNYEKYDAFVLSCSDILVSSNFFSFYNNSKINRYKKFMVISHPNIMIDGANKVKISNIESGVDLFCFVNLTKKDLRKIIEIEKTYTSYDYGLYDIFLIVLTRILKIKSYNIFSDSRIIKFCNIDDESVEKHNESREKWKSISSNKNQETYFKLAKKYKISSYFFKNIMLSFLLIIKINFNLTFLLNFLKSLVFLFLVSFYRKYFKREKNDIFESVSKRYIKSEF